MRAMPNMAQASLNPNDYSSSIKGGPGYQKKQFADANQHYIHHNAVLPVTDLPPNYARNAAGQRSPHSRDPYESLPTKPNQMTMQQANQLQMQQNASTPAGVISELRKSSPSGHTQNEPASFSRGRDIGGKDSLGSKVGMSQIAGEYRVPDYGSIQKVMPGSREGIGA